MAPSIPYRALLAVAGVAALSIVQGIATASPSVGDPPPGFSSAMANLEGARLHYVRGGHGPALILLHGFPEDWVEYRAIMQRLAHRFSVVAIDLPGLGQSAPIADGYDAANLAAHIHALLKSLNIDRQYIVGHDFGGLVTYAYIRSFPDSVRGAMILDVPVPGLDGWDKAIAGVWPIGFAQAPKELAEKLVADRQAPFLGWNYDLGKFTPQMRQYYVQAYGAAQLHAAFEIYRAFPKDGEWNAAQTSSNAVPVVIAVAENSFFSPFLQAFIEGYRAKGMAHVEGAHVPGAAHYLLADNPDAVAELIEQHAGSASK
jgi:pimeloyl-ACP methyl ester carboxylesterase